MKYIFNYQSIAAKVGANALFLLLIIAFSSGYSWYAMSEIGRELKTIAEEDIPLTNILTKITEHQLEQTIHLERALRYGGLMQGDKKAEASFSLEVKKFDTLSQLVESEIHQGEALIEGILKVEHVSTDSKEFENINTLLLRIEKEHATFEDHAHTVFDLFKQQKQADAHILVKQIEKEEERLNHELEALLESVEAFTEEAALRAEAHEQLAANIIALLGIIGLIIGGLSSLLLSRWLINRLKNTQRKLEKIATGDLGEKIEIRGNDEISKLQGPIVEMQTRFVDLISHIASSTFQLSSSSEQVSAVMQQTSANIQQQQFDTEQVANAMDHLITSVRDVSESVAGASGAANKANTEANTGQKIVQDAVNGVENLALQIDTTAEVVSELERDSENINTVLDVIKGIAEKTNLLALNAAIEAARAGEQGRGFAVVADEVRTLAGRTQESTAEINQIIEKLQSGARKAVSAMNESREQTQDLVTKASLAGTSLETIAASVAHINEMSSSMAVATEHQNEVSNDMSTSIRQISDMTDANTNSIQEVTQAGAELASLASELQGVVEQYQTG
jgi:methyl-accepting chemotaxis protein